MSVLSSKHMYTCMHANQRCCYVYSDTYTQSVGLACGLVSAALLPAVGTCVVLVFGAMPGR